MEGLEGLKRLEKELEDIKGTMIRKVFDFLKSKPQLYKAFNNEEKSLKQLKDYLWSMAWKIQEDNVACPDDNVVYLWAVMYFLKSNEELGLKDNKNNFGFIPKENETTEKAKKEVINQTKKEKKKDTKSQISMFEEVQK